MASRSAHAAATAVLPTAVGPTRTGVRGRRGASTPPKSPLQLILRQLNHGRSAVHVVRRERGREETGHELAHLVGFQPLTRFDGGAASVGRREALQPVGPPPQPPPP